MTDKHEPDVLDEVIEEVQDVVSDFLNREAAPGILLMGATILALIIANSPLDTLYDHLISMPVQISAGTWAIDKPLLLWINDGLMAVFFFHVGLELKREICEGELANPKDICASNQCNQSRTFRGQATDQETTHLTVAVCKI